MGNDRLKDPFEAHWAGNEDPTTREESDKERIERIRAQLKRERERPVFGGKMIHETDKEFLLRKYDELYESFVGE